MSTFEDKYAAVKDFLLNRASQNRLTDYNEVQRVVADMLHRRQQRHHAQPISREKIAKVLKKLDDETLANGNYMLSSIVVHFWDRKAGHRFFEQAQERGFFNYKTTDEDRQEFHKAQVKLAFKSNREFYPVILEPIPDTAEELEDYDDYDEVEDYEDSQY